MLFRKNSRRQNLSNKTTRQKIASWLILMLVLTSVGTGIVAPKPTKAGIVDVAQLELAPGTESAAGAIRMLTGVTALSPGLVTTDPGAKIQSKTFNWFEIIYNKIEKVYDQLGALGFRQGLKRLVSNIAVQTATYLATGDKAQMPMFKTNFWKYIRGEGDAFLGDALNNNIKARWGVDLCEPPNQLAKIKIELRAREYFTSPKPQCSFTKMREKLSTLKLAKTVDLPAIADMFNPTSNDLGIFMDITTKIIQGRKEKIDEAKLLTFVEGQWNSVRSKIKGDIKTPASITKFFSELPFSFELNEKNVFTGNLAADFIQPFVNTFFSKLMKKYKEGLVKDQPRPSAGGGASWLGGGSGGGIAAARERFAELGQPDYNFSGPFDALNNLSCNTGSQFSCAIDAPLRSALEQAPSLTVRQALDQGLLHGDWDFGYRNDKSGEIANINDRIYSYRSLLILRKYRIIPVGWELAAEYFKKYDNSGKSLVLDASQGSQNSISLIDEYNNSDSPYYKLVDPSWILKAPETICRREGAGEHVLNTEYMVLDLNGDGIIQNNERFEIVSRESDYCADERTCIKERADGSGCDFFGYCVEEKPIWKIHGDECGSVFNTCRSFTRRDGSDVNYLTNTLDEWNGEVCDSGNVDCREYCVDWDIKANNWKCTISSGEKMYLDRDASDHQCDSKEAGCSEFYRLGSQDDLAEAENGNFKNFEDYELAYRANLKKAPDYLDCQNYTELNDSVTVTDEECQSPLPDAVYWWRDDIEACVKGGAAECADYALYCGDRDNNYADCKFYKPVSYKGPKVPGVITDDDTCPLECVGYKTYIEKKTNFDLPQTPERILNLIASKAQSCPASDIGCEEFTNMSEDPSGENREYYSYLRACVSRDHAQKTNYYTFETIEEPTSVGDDFVRVDKTLNWELLKSNMSGYNGPCTNTITDTSGTVTCNDNASNRKICSTNKQDLDFSFDCLEFVDIDGQKYKVKQSSVVFASDECTLLRRTYDQNYYSAILSQSTPCAASSVGCREYRGSLSNNITEIINDDFEDGTNQGWIGGTNNNTSLALGGHSLYSAGDDRGVKKEVVDLINRKTASYKLSFWAKHNAPSASVVDILDIRLGGTDFINAAGTDIHDYWKLYLFDLREFTVADDNLDTILLQITAQDNFYIDNIILTETQDSFYLIKDSWRTPESCDGDAPASGAMLGCEQYRDARNNNIYLKSFAKLCRDELVGCEAMVDIKNSDSLLTDDTLKYIVYDQNKKCTDLGCGAYGLIWPDTDGVNISYETKYMIVEPDDYGGPYDPKCVVNELWCDEFIDSDRATNYFKNPYNFVCEYGKDGDNNSGWYKQGTTESCPSVAVSESGRCIGGRAIINGNTATNFCESDEKCSDYATMSQPGLCSNWVGWCEPDQDTCMEFQDPARPVDCDKVSVNGESYDPNNTAAGDSEENACDFYYYLLNTIEKCSGGVNLSEGCLPFNQTQDGDQAKYFSTKHCFNFQAPYQPCEYDADCRTVSGELEVCDTKKTLRCNNMPDRACTTNDNCSSNGQAICGYDDPMSN